MPLADVPVGQDESSNKCMRMVGEPPKFDFKPKAHYELGEALGMMDFQTAAKISGSRFVFAWNACSDGAGSEEFYARSSYEAVRI